MSVLTESQISLIAAVAEGDLTEARKRARRCVNEDTTKKNEEACRKLARELRRPPKQKAEKAQNDIPPDIQPFLSLEESQKDVPWARYYCSPREKDVYEQIVREQATCAEMKAMGLKRVTSVLLEGEEGTGKSLFARYVAHELGSPLYRIDCARIDEHGGTRQLEAALAYAKERGGVVLVERYDLVSHLPGAAALLGDWLAGLDNERVVIATSGGSIAPRERATFLCYHEVTTPADKIEASCVIELLLDDVGAGYDSDDILSFCATCNNKPHSYLVDATMKRIAAALEERRERAAEGESAGGELFVAFTRRRPSLPVDPFANAPQARAGSGRAEAEETEGAEEEDGR